MCANRRANYILLGGCGGMLPQKSFEKIGALLVRGSLGFKVIMIFTYCCQDYFFRGGGGSQVSPLYETLS